ncbi:Phosphoinositide phosphatase sac1, partial [Coemansia sp. RSA 2618]
AARGGGAEHLVIDRTSGAVATAKAGAGAFSAAPQRTLSVHGVMGMIQLQRGPYLVLITGREAAGAIGAATVYRVTETRVVRASADRVPAGFDALDEAAYVRLLEAALQTPAFYFSYDTDVTNTLQRQARGAPTHDEFFFNKYLLEPIAGAVGGGPSVYVLPVMHGFFACRQARVAGAAFNYVLVTRRGRRRQGTRYFSRGADEQGNVSNYAETEQIADFAAPNASGAAGAQQMSYVQVRGSIPAAWAQVPNMYYAPELRVDVGGSAPRFQQHVARMLGEYGEVVAVNLVNKVKYEKPMGDAFAALAAQAKSPAFHYVHFDFHRECSRMRWDRISLLLDELRALTDRFGYFAGAHGAPPTREQRGVVRTNCMDCLDRTNVVQSELARAALARQLRDADIIGAGQTVTSFPDLAQMLNDVWADNADCVSCAYSGTGALKTDFTRTGRRTRLGALQDARNSVERYVRGNFFDGERQDGIDLLLGAFRVRAGVRPFAQHVTLESRALVGTVYVCLFMLAYAVFYPRGGHWFGASNVVFTGAWWLVLALVFYTVRMAHTAELVNWPRLVAYPNRPPVTHANTAIALPFVDRWLPSNEPVRAGPADKKRA